MVNFPDINLSGILPTRKLTGTQYSFRVRADSFKKYSRIIGFTHNDKKNRLQFNIEITKREWDHRPRGETKRLILEKLKLKPQTAKELSFGLGITSVKIRYDLVGHYKSGKRILGLSDLGYVEQNGKGKRGANIWKITEKGLNFLEKGENFV